MPVAIAQVIHRAEFAESLRAPFERLVAEPAHLPAVIELGVVAGSRADFALEGVGEMRDFGETGFGGDLGDG